MKLIQSIPILLSLILLGFSTQITAQCMDVNLSTQAEVDAWVAANPTCTQVQHLNIFGSGTDNIQDLSGLSNIVEVNGSITISNNLSLTNLDGLQNIAFVAVDIYVTNNLALENIDGLIGIQDVMYLTIQNNASLQNLNGLANLNFVVGEFLLDENPSLSSLSGLSNLDDVTMGFTIRQNDGLSSLDGLQGLTALASPLYIFENDGLIDLTGLENLTNTLGLQIFGNSNLTSLNGLQGLNTMDEVFDISMNASLTSLDGLENLHLVQFLSIVDNANLTNIDGIANLDPMANFLFIEIMNNPSLSDCSILSICEWIFNGYTYNLMVEGNAPGCEDIGQIEQGCAFSTITGNLLLDENQDCLVTTDSVPLSGWKIMAESPSFTRFTFTDSLGNFKMNLLEEEFTFSTVPPNSLWNFCNNTNTYMVSPDTSIHIADMLAGIDSDCELLEVEIGAPLLRRCFENTFIINYGNVGGVEVPNAYIKVYTQDLFENFNSSTPFTYDVDSNLIFQIGDLSIGEGGQIVLKTTVSCDAEFEQVLCLTAEIFPNETCVPQSSPWSGAELRLDGSCKNDTTFLIIENTGIGDMDGASVYRLYKNAVLIDTGFFQLIIGESFILSIPADGCTYRLETDQVDDFPIPTFPSITIEGCQIVGEDFTTGYFLVHPIEDYGSTFERFCLPVIGSFDPNDKQGFPIGFGDGHFIEQNQPIDFLVRFQNTGTDTAFNIVVLDTLSPNFDMASLELGASSHPLQFEIIEDRTLQFSFENIMLPDSFINEPASNGFFKYRVRQVADLPMGTEFYNSASIYFDFNEPVKTNTTFHSLGIATVLDSTEVVLCEGEIYNGVMYLQNTTLYDTIAFSVFENINVTEIQVIPLAETVIDTTLVFGGIYDGVVYEMDATLQETLMDQYGCDSIVTTNIMVLPVGVSQPNFAKNIKVKTAPNPFQSQVFFKLENADFDFGKIEIFDVMGKSVMRQDFKNKNFEVKTESFAQGIYIYKILLDGKTLLGGKILKE